MRAEHDFPGPKKWWISGGAAVFTHLAVMLVLPDAPSGRITPLSTGPCEFEVTTFVSAEANVTGSVLTASAASGTAASQGSMRSTVSASARRSTRSHARAPHTAAVPSHEVPRDVRDEEADERRAAASGSASDAEPALREASALEATVAHTTTLEASTANQGADTLAAAAAGGSALSRGAGGGGVGGLGSGFGGLGRGRAPGLVATRNPCTGYFPATARANQGSVQISVRVDASGHTRASHVLNEMPRGQEFGSAARACAAALHFVPASDGRGTPIDGEAKLELRFSRT